MYSRYLFILATMILLLGCLPDFEKIGMSIAEDYVAIPDSVEGLHAHYVGAGQYRAVYIRFELPENRLDSFLSTTCFGDIVVLADEETPFHRGSTPDDLPDWWSSYEGEIIGGGTCERGNVAYEIDISRSLDTVLVRLRLNFP